MPDLMTETPAQPAPIAARASALYAVAVGFSMANGLSSVLLPLTAIALGASPSRVGLVGACYMGGYGLMCLLIGPHLDKVKPRNCLLMGNVVYVLIALLMGFTHTVNLIIALTLIYGVLMVLIWPPLMSWVAHGLDGPNLNRRLGRYNISWCSGMIIGPFLGGWLAQYDPRMSFGVLAALHLCLVALTGLTRTRQPETARAQQAGSDATNGHVLHPQNDLYKLMARIAMVCGFLAVGIVRFQYPVLADSLLISKETFGTVILTFSLANTVAFGVLGKTHYWHYRAWMLWTSQAVLAISLALSSLIHNPVQMIAIAAAIGTFVTLTYTSSLYYGVSGQTQRTRMTAIHELLLSTGTVLGSVVGGYLTEWAGLTATYPICAAIILGGIACQIMVYMKRRTQSGHANS